MSDPPSQLMRLVSAGRAGDRSALGALLEAVLPDVRAAVRLNCGRGIREREAASDIVQSVCREVLEDLHQFQGDVDAQFRSWLLTVTLNKIQSRRRFHMAQQRDMRRDVALGGGDRSGAEPVERELLERYGTFCTPSRVGMAHEEMQRIEAAFEELPEDYRQVITLACVLGLPHREIAVQMDRQETAVRKLLSRARARLGLLLAMDGTEGA